MISYSAGFVTIDGVQLDVLESVEIRNAVEVEPMTRMADGAMSCTISFEPSPDLIAFCERLIRRGIALRRWRDQRKPRARRAVLRAFSRTS